MPDKAEPKKDDADVIKGRHRVVEVAVGLSQGYVVGSGRVTQRHV